MNCGERESSPESQLPPILPPPRLCCEDIQPSTVGDLQQLLPNPGLAETQLLAPRHRPERQIAGTAGQRLRDPAHQKQVGRACHEKASRSSVPVDLALDRAQEIRLALNFVQGDRTGAADEDVGVAAGEIEYVEIVERQVLAAGGGWDGRWAAAGIASPKGTREGGLPGLARPANDNGGHDAHHGLEERWRSP